PSDILVGGQPQRPVPAQIIADHGSGWYEYEPDNQSRWASSPAELLIYSPQAQQARIEILANTMFNGKDGLGERGALLIAANGEAAQRLPLEVGKPLTAEVALRAGWNKITLALEAGNFQPSAIFAGNGDQRQLSFVLRQVNIVAGRR